MVTQWTRKVISTLNWKVIGTLNWKYIAHYCSCGRLIIADSFTFHNYLRQITEKTQFKKSYRV